jgi:hypothetical protein
LINTIPLRTSASVTTLRLINADTNQPILTMTDGMTTTGTAGIPLKITFTVH